MNAQALENKFNLLFEKLDVIIGLMQGAPSAMANITPPCAYTLHAWLDEWLKEYKAPNVASGTLYAYGVAVRVHIKPSVPDLPLSHYNGLELQKFLTSIENTRTRETVRNVLAAAFREAANLNFISDNPMKAVKIPKHKREKGSPLSPGEIEQFLTDIKGHALERYFKFLLYTGCRRSEALALRRADVDFEKNKLHVPGTKTETSDRTIPLFENARCLLVDLQYDKSGFYFKFRADSATRAFKRFCPAHKLHDLRHTFATKCLEAKIPMKVVQKWLGHADFDTTADIYSHVTEELNTEQAAVLNVFLQEKRPS